MDCFVNKEKKGKLCQTYYLIHPLQLRRDRLLPEGGPPQQVLERLGGRYRVRDAVGHLRMPACRRRGQRSVVVQGREGPAIGQVSST